MKPYLKRIFCTILILSTYSTGVSATAIPPHYNFEVLDNATSETQTKIYNTITEINKFDDQLSQLIDTITINKNKIAKLTVDINTNSTKIEITKKNLEAKQKLFDDRIRAMYIYQNNNSIALTLFSSTGLNDFLSRLSVIKNITHYDKNIVNDFKSEKEKLSAEETTLTESKNKIIKLNEETVQNQNSSIEQKDKLMTLLSTLNIVRAQEVESSSVNYLQDKLKQDYLTYTFPDLRLSKEVIANKNSLDFYSSVDLDTPIKVSGQDIVMYASSLMGINYLWGGNDAKGLDCSGFTKYVYKHFGIIIPRVAADQQKVGIDVLSQADLQPGDLLFFGESAHHVAIFLTKGFMLEAPYTGEVIKVSPIRSYTNAKRYIGLSKDEVATFKKSSKKGLIQPNELDDTVQELP